MRRIAHVSGAEVTGINNNTHQLKRPAYYNRKHGFERRCHLVHEDFMGISLPSASFDAAYEFDASVHSVGPRNRRIRSEVGYREALK